MWSYWDVVFHENYSTNILTNGKNQLDNIKNKLIWNFRDLEVFWKTHSIIIPFRIFQLGRKISFWSYYSMYFMKILLKILMKLFLWHPSLSKTWQNGKKQFIKGNVFFRKMAGVHVGNPLSCCTAVREGLSMVPELVMDSSPGRYQYTTYYV